MEYLVSPEAFVPLIILAGEFVDGYWHLDGNAAWARIVVLGALLCSGVWVLDLGFMAGLSIVDGAFEIATVVLIATGVFHIPFVKTVLAFVRLRVKG